MAFEGLGFRWFTLSKFLMASMMVAIPCLNQKLEGCGVAWAYLSMSLDCVRRSILGILSVSKRSIFT